MKNNKYIIYKGTGGLIHMLCGLVHCIDFCKKNNWFLIIDVISHKCYTYYLNNFFLINNFNNYSEDYNNNIINNNLTFMNMSIDYIKNYPDVEINNKHYYKINNINIRCDITKKIDHKDNIRIYAGPGSCKPINILKYIKIKPEILLIIKNKPIIKDYIGIHFRNTDIKNDINYFINIIKNNPYKNIYLATDDYNAYNIIKENLPNYNIIQYTKPTNNNGQPIHYDNNISKYDLILNLLIDIYYLYKSNIYIPSNISMVSNLVKVMRENKVDIF
jgi:hypothetical protein